MEVNMLDRLTPILTDVGDNPVSVFKPTFLGNLGNRLKDSSNVKRVVCTDSICRLDMALGNDKNVNGSLRCNITESIDLVVLVDLG
jgi:hypothetical protein